jgi:hypothetical protein
VRILADVDARLALRLTRTVARQFEYAVARALNLTATDFQAEERRGIEARFTLRRRDFVLRTVKVERADFARRGKLYVDVGIDPRRDILAKFEPGGVKRARGGGALAVPQDVRRSDLDVVPRSRRPRAFHFRVHRTKRGAVQLKGERRTFILEQGFLRGGIFQRTGRGPRSSVRLLYLFTRAVPIAPDLRFAQTAMKISKTRFTRNFQQAFLDALRTAR